MSDAAVFPGAVSSSATPEDDEKKPDDDAPAVPPKPLYDPVIHMRLTLGYYKKRVPRERIMAAKTAPRLCVAGKYSNCVFVYSIKRDAHWMPAGLAPFCKVEVEKPPEPEVGIF